MYEVYISFHVSRRALRIRLLVPLTRIYVPCFAIITRMSELSKMEEAEQQGLLEDVDTLQTPEEHTRNLAMLKEQKEKRTRYCTACQLVLSTLSPVASMSHDRSLVRAQ